MWNQLKSQSNKTVLYSIDSSLGWLFLFVQVIWQGKEELYV